MLLASERMDQLRRRKESHLRHGPWHGSGPQRKDRGAGGVGPAAAASSQRRPPIQQTWRFVLIKSALFLVIFFTLHTLFTRYVLDPVFRRAGTQSLSTEQILGNNGFVRRPGGHGWEQV